MTERNADLVHRGMLRRSVDSSRYRGLVRPDKPLRWAVEQLEKVEQMRGRPSAAWPTATALPESLDRLAEILTELGWDDLPSLARREELMVYRELDADQPGAYSVQITHALTALRGNLLDIERYEEALDVVDEQLRLLLGTSRSAQGAARDARYWRTELLARLGRHEEAVGSAAAAVDEIREWLRRDAGASVKLELSGARAAYANQLDVVGRVTEAAEVTAEVVAYWRERSDSTVNFLATVDLLSERLVRSGRTEEAGVLITEAMRKVQRRKPRVELAGTWHNFSVRLLSLGLPENALNASKQAVRLYRELAHEAQEQHREVEAADDWDDDHRYTQWYLLQRRREELKSSYEYLRRAELKLHDGLLALSICLRQLNRIDEATAADDEAAALAQHLARPSGHVPPDPA